MRKVAFLISLGFFAALMGCASEPQKAATDEQAIAPDASQDVPDADLKSPNNSEQAFEQKTDSEKRQIIADSNQKFSQAMKTKNYRLAAEIGADVLSKKPNDTKTLNGLAVIAIEQNKFDLAKMYLSKLLAKEQNAAAYNNLGVIELKSDNLRLALVNFKKAVELDPSNKSAHANLGAIYLQYRNYPAAVNELQAAANRGDDSASVYSNLGFAYKGIGKYNEAENAYEKALTKDGGNVNILMNYAILLVENLQDNSKGLKIINKLRMLASEPGIIERADKLAKMAEAKGKQ